MNVLLQAFFMFLFFAINNEDFDCREKWEIIKNGNLSITKHERNEVILRKS